jgi:hypothetical protein
MIKIPLENPAFNFVYGCCVSTREIANGSQQMRRIESSVGYE